jgi:tRNA pseudouridine55 synthase
MTGFDKEYVAEVTLGATSNTDDSEGEIISDLRFQISDSNFNPPNEKEISNALKEFTGEIQQVPPQFSAKKIDGRRAYKMARAGKIVDLKPSVVTVYDIEVLSYKWPKLSLKIKCGKGTYIRSIARDLGEKLKVGGYLSALERTAVGKYRIEDAIKIGDLSAHHVIPL